jgi:hypothetical protein
MTSRILRAGPLTLLFQDGDIRSVRLGGREVLQRVYIAVRDRNWGTVPRRIEDLTILDRGDAFEIRYSAEHNEHDIHFRCGVSIVGSASGEILWSMEGIALTSFLRNRIGYCVLHSSLECAGQPCSVETMDGRIEHGEFPRFVSPHQPFNGIRSISHDVEPGVTAEVRFSGDVFEMEDQRNWTDASFKTFSTPLALPFPVLIEAGAEVRQSVHLKVKGASERPAEPEGPITIGLSQECFAVPALGLGGAEVVLDAQAAAELARLRLAHLRVDLKSDNIAGVLETAACNARMLGVDLEVAIDVKVDLAAVAEACARLRPRIARWLVSPGSAAAPRRHLGPGCLAAGSDANFAELNRHRPDPSTCDALWFALNPQVHAFDDRSIVENLPAQASAVESARRFANGKPVIVSPVTMKPRFNAVATEALDQEPPSDPRQRTWFCAAWTLGSLRYLGGAGAHSITYYEVTGSRGVLNFPVFDLLAGIAEFAGGEIVLTRSSQPLSVEALALRKGGRTRLLLANFTDSPQQVEVAGETFRAEPACVTSVERS